MADERRRDHLYSVNHEPESKHIQASRTPPPPRLLAPRVPVAQLSRTPPLPQHRITPPGAGLIPQGVFQRSSIREPVPLAQSSRNVPQIQPGHRASPNNRVSPVPPALLLTNNPSQGAQNVRFEATGLVQLAVPRGANPQAVVAAQHRISPQPVLAGIPAIRLPEGDYLTPGHISAVTAMSNNPAAAEAMLLSKGLVPIGVHNIQEPPRRHPSPLPSTSSLARPRPPVVPVGDGNLKPESVESISSSASHALAKLLQMRNPQVTLDKNSTELFVAESQKTASDTHPVLQSQLNQHPSSRGRGHSPQPPLRGAHSPNPPHQRGPTPPPNSSVPPKLAPPVIQVPAGILLSKVPSDISPFAHLPRHSSVNQQVVPETMPHLVPEERTREQLMNSDHSYGKEHTIQVTNHNIKQETTDDPPNDDSLDATPPFNMRVTNLNNFPVAQSSYRATYRSHSVAILRAKAGAITNTAKSLDLLRQNLQNDINKEIDIVIQKYVNEYFTAGINNIKSNCGDDSVTDDHIQGVCRQMLEEAKKMYASETRSITPDISDNVSDAGSLVENRTVRENKRSLFNIRQRKRRNSSDSEASSTQPRRKKKGRPPIAGSSGRSTPSKTGKNEIVKREGPKWDPDRLKADVTFVMGAKANKALGLGQTRGRLYIKHPEVFKYSGDQEDKTWLYENHHMPATGGKAYLLLVQDIKDLAESDEYKNNSGLLLNEIVAFSVPEWMLEKMKAQMLALHTDKFKIKTLPSEPSVENHDQDDEEDDDKSKLDEEEDKVDDDDDKGLPFSLGYGANALLTNSKLDVALSPSNTDNLEVFSTEQDDDDPPSISPLNMTGGFGEVSPAPDASPIPSDIDSADDDDGPLTAPFDLQSS